VKQRNKFRAILIGAAIIVFGLFFGLKREETEDSFQTYEENFTDQTSGGSKETTKETSPQTTKAPAKIYVYVTGAVQNPGVYVLNENARVFEAIEMAGGLSEDADFNQLNQAAILSDGYHLYVPRIGETNASYAGGKTGENTGNDGSTSGKKVNINTATAEELQTLSGIGESKALAIIAYRKENGSFSCIEDLLNVSGIGEGIFAKIKDCIEV